MGLEAFSFISQLVNTNPVGATDPKSQGDDHIRGIKTTLQNSFPNVSGAVTATHTQLGYSASFVALNTFTEAIKSDTDNTDDVGTNAVRWRRLYALSIRADDTHNYLDNNANVLEVGNASGWTFIKALKDFSTERSNSGGNVDLLSVNTSNTANSNARVVAQVAGTSANDALMVWLINGGQSYSAGLDNSDGDKFKLGRNTDLSLPALTIDTSGVLKYFTASAEREVGFRNGQGNSQAAGYTFVSSDNGRLVGATSAGNFTINTGVFASDDIVTFVNTTGANCTLVQGAGVTLRLAGAPGVTGNRTVSDYGWATILSQNGSVFLVTGAGVS